MYAYDIADLRFAKSLLERPALTEKIAHLLGRSLRQGAHLLPTKWSEAIHEVTRKSLNRALDVAVSTLADKPNLRSKDLFIRYSWLRTEQPPAP